MVSEVSWIGERGGECGVEAARVGGTMDVIVIVPSSGGKVDAVPRIGGRTGLDTVRVDVVVAPRMVEVVPWIGGRIVAGIPRMGGSTEVLATVMFTEVSLMGGRVVIDVF